MQSLIRFRTPVFFAALTVFVVFGFGTITLPSTASAFGDEELCCTDSFTTTFGGWDNQFASTFGGFDDSFTTSFGGWDNQFASTFGGFDDSSNPGHVESYNPGYTESYNPGYTESYNPGYSSVTPVYSQGSGTSVTPVYSQGRSYSTPSYSTPRYTPQPAPRGYTVSTPTPFYPPYQPPQYPPYYPPQNPPMSQQPTCTITANPANVGQNGATTLVWSSQNATSASLSGIGAVPVSGNRAVSGISGTRVYTLVISGPGGSNTCSTTVYNQQQQLPTCTIAASPTSVQQGGSTVLSWSSQNATSATLTDVGSVPVSGSRSMYNLSTTRTYVLTVVGQGGTNTCSVSVGVYSTPVVPPHTNVPSCTITAHTNTVSYGQYVTLTWNSYNATSASISHIGAVALDGSRSVMPNGTMTYTMTVYGNGGTNTCSTTVYTGTVPPVGQVPSCSISVSPTYVSGYQTATLSWSSAHATYASISGLGIVSTNGYRSVQPGVTTTYVMTVTGPGGSNTCSTTLYSNYQSYPVPYPQPHPVPSTLSCSVSASPSVIRNGQSSVLSWTSYGAVSAVLSDGLGPVSTNGSLSVRPESSRYYTLSVRDAYGNTRTCGANVSVNGSYVSLSAVPYTGLDLGIMGSILYWGALVAWAFGAAYLVVAYKGGILGAVYGLMQAPAAPRAVRPDAVILNETIVAKASPAPQHNTANEDVVVAAIEHGSQTTDAMTLEGDGTMPRIVITRQ